MRPPSLECRVKAALFMLALIVGIAKNGGMSNDLLTPLAEAYSCLTASCAWRNPLPDTIGEYSQIQAGCVRTLGFQASLQFWELEWLLPEAVEPSHEPKEVRRLPCMLILVHAWRRLSCDGLKSLSRHEIRLLICLQSALSSHGITKIFTVRFNIDFYSTVNLAGTRKKDVQVGGRPLDCIHQGSS